MFKDHHPPKYFESWHIIRNHLIKKYPALRHYDLDYIKGSETRLLNRIRLLTGISENTLKKEIYTALTNSNRTRTTMQYY